MGVVRVLHGTARHNSQPASQNVARPSATPGPLKVNAHTGPGGFPTTRGKGLALLKTKTGMFSMMVRLTVDTSLVRTQNLVVERLKACTQAGRRAQGAGRQAGKHAQGAGGQAGRRAGRQGCHGKALGRGVGGGGWLGGRGVLRGGVAWV